MDLRLLSKVSQKRDFFFLFFYLQYKESRLTEKAVQATLGQFTQKQTEVLQFSCRLWSFGVDVLLVVFGFGVCEDVRLQVGRLGKFFVAAVEGADVRAVSSVNPHMSAQVKVQREALAASLKRAL